MSRHRLTITVAAGLRPTAVAASRVAHEQRLIVREEREGFLRVSENRLTMNPWANAVTLEVAFRAEGPVTTGVEIAARNIGLGPIQSRHVRGIAESFAARLAELAEVKF